MEQLIRKSGVCAVVQAAVVCPASPTWVVSTEFNRLFTINTGSILAGHKVSGYLEMFTICADLVYERSP
jgi:hypothetical protein